MVMIGADQLHGAGNPADHDHHDHHRHQQQHQRFQGPLKPPARFQFVALAAEVIGLRPLPDQP
jgi:hypothetical protein